MSAIFNGAVSTIQSFAQKNTKTAMALGGLTLTSTFFGKKISNAINEKVKNVPVLSYLPSLLKISNTVYSADNKLATKGYIGMFAYGALNATAAAALYFAYKG